MYTIYSSYFVMFYDVSYELIFVATDVENECGNFFTFYVYY